MKRLTAVMMAFISITAIYASPMPYGTDSSFTIDWLLENDYELDFDKDGNITVDPPAGNRKLQDPMIEDFTLIMMPDQNNWISAYCIADAENYQEVYDYISANYGEGMSKKSTRFFSKRYSSEPGEEQVAQAMLSGEFSDMLINYSVAQTISEILNEVEEYDDYNLWTGEEVTILTASYMEQVYAILYINTGYIRQMTSNLMGLAILASMGDL